MSDVYVLRSKTKPGRVMVLSASVDTGKAKNHPDFQSFAQEGPLKWAIFDSEPVQTQKVEVR